MPDVEVLDELRNAYLCMEIYARGKAQDKVGGGYRVLFLSATDGRDAIIYNTMGERLRLHTEDLHVVRVLDAQGRPLGFRVAEADGHLYVMTAEGGWLDYGPWSRYDPGVELQEEEEIEPVSPF